ncbi:MAG: response regulator [Magnetococcales bacterium]|nr:response regulator [Magnetococcales bacterium]MBF0151558.1 response regulator [Magnetococcales bacterium]MBF0173701.1 response regulator [Magnetococcales bacterium]MBF0346683.1 response regulator [Magnetococcales bacterium]MBF0632241.1 response regulator [Magnetococcales bacterium]
MSKTPCILVVEDNREIRELVVRYLDEHGMAATGVANGRAMRGAMEKGGVDLVVLDVMLPEADGLTLCRKLREHSTIPIIMLTALGEHSDRVVGLEMGADDYVTKPFDPRELLARIKAVLRRCDRNEGRTPLDLGNTIHFAGWTLHRQRRELVDAQGLVEPLSSGEFDLLLAFISHPRQVLSRERLLDLAHGKGAQQYDRSIDTQIMRLRRKIEPDPREPQLIKTVWGDGYMFTPEVSAT